MQFHSSNPFFIAHHSTMKPFSTILAHDWEPKCWPSFCITVTVSQSPVTAPEHYSMYYGPEVPERLKLFCCQIYFLSFLFLSFMFLYLYDAA